MLNVIITFNIIISLIKLKHYINITIYGDINVIRFIIVIADIFLNL